MNPIILNDGRLLVPYMKILPSYAVLFSQPDFRMQKTDEEKETTKNNFRKKNDGLHLSKKTQRKIENAVNWLLQLSEYKTIEINGKKVKSKLSFITLTLPTKQTHTDNEIKAKCLNQFLIEMKQRHPDFLYIWKTERQKNDNIHFHITTNITEHYQVIQRIWNRCVNKLGYVDEYTNNMKTKYKNGFLYDLRLQEKYGHSREKQKQMYENSLKTGFREPHSTEIKSVRNIKNIAAYISKYIVKDINEDSKRIDGNLWSCSELLSNMNITFDLLDVDFEFFKYPQKQNDFTTAIYASINHLLTTELKNKIIPKLEELFKLYAFKFSA